MRDGAALPTSIPTFSAMPDLDMTLPTFPGVGSILAAARSMGPTTMTTSDRWPNEICQNLQENFQVKTFRTLSLLFANYESGFRDLRRSQNLPFYMKHEEMTCAGLSARS